MTTRKDLRLFARIGEALYGPRWQTDLANDLDVADRTLRRWIANESAIPAGVWEQLFSKLQGRRVLLADLCEEISDRLSAS